MDQWRCCKFGLLRAAWTKSEKCLWSGKDSSTFLPTLLATWKVGLNAPLGALPDNTKLYGVGDTLGGRAAMQRDHDGLERCPMKTSRQPMRILWHSTRSSARSFTWVRAVPSTNTDWMVNKSRTALRRRTWECLWWKAQCDIAVYSCSPKRQPHSGLHQKQCDQQVENWGDSSPLVHSWETLPGVRVHL